jgi:predicted RNA-binding protein YlxR (DUF448 family)
MARVTQSRRPRARHVPERTCVACAGKAAKRQLVRLVRTPQGAVEVDPTGKRAGRGAYLHAEARCWELALTKGRLEHHLKTKLGQDERARLLDYAANLAAESPATPERQGRSAAEDTNES